jgi:hypothetical protein
MSIPLDRLYHYIESVAEKIRGDHVLIYRFFPHGSKKPEDLTLINDYAGHEEILSPHVICYDQEPLYYGLYDVDTPIPEFRLTLLPEGIREICRQIKFDKSNLRNYTVNMYDHAILIHSERRSVNVDKYNENNFIPVYYWSHAVIARDWFRYAEHVRQKKMVASTFLIYNRAWSGTREYRLKFAEHLVRLGLDSSCLMRVGTLDSATGKHYDLHTFENPVWGPKVVIENFFPECTADSHSSADFDLRDYESTAIEVVLETLFDDDRLHLTEKTLRPIAMGQPFILAATHGSLEYLRDYGFKTFSDCWDESYDVTTDPVDRLCKITNIMKNISCMLPSKQKEMLARAQVIADHNQQHFFSDKFQTQVSKELHNNLTVGLACIEELNTGQRFLNRRKKMLANAEYRKYSILNKENNSEWRKGLASFLKQARKYKLRTLPPA